MEALGQNEQSAPSNFSYTLHLVNCPNHCTPHMSDNNRGLYSFMPLTLSVCTQISNLSIHWYFMRPNKTLAFVWIGSQSNMGCLQSIKASQHGLSFIKIVYIQNYVLTNLSISMAGSKIMALVHGRLISTWMHFSMNLSAMKKVCLASQIFHLVSFLNIMWKEKHVLKS